MKRVVGFFVVLLLFSCEQRERCSNGLDDDNDGKIDCYDSDCVGASACTEVCGSGKDEDLDGRIDCDDPECLMSPFCIAQRCGNGQLDQGEGCDLLVPLNQTCESLGYYPGALTCSSLCQLDTTGCGGYCGDGILQGNEQCDEGPANGDNGTEACRSTCVSARCGDLIIDSDEECDEGSANSDMPDATCRTDCRTGGCGDGIVDSAEGCDEGAGNSSTLPDRCREDCSLPGCGEGVIDDQEECDEADLGGA